MKNASKLPLFTAAVLQALLLFMPISALAAAEDGQEIGVPQAMEAPVKGCFGAVLSPDGDHFYTVREGLLTQYQIKPFKKVGSIAIDWEPFKETRSEGSCRVLITNDKSKLIFVYSKTIFLLDAKTGQILNKSERKNGSMAATAINDNELVVLDQFFSEDKGYSFNLTIWDADTLKLKREIRDLGKSFGFVYSGGVFPSMSKIQDRIYMTASAKSFVVLNSKTYMPELTLAVRPDFHAPSFADGSPKISKNFQKLYVPKASVVTDHLTGKHTSYDEFKFSSVLVFDQKMREFSIVNANSISREELDPFLVHSSQLTRNKDYVMLSGGSHARASLYLNTGMWFGFYQYESGEEILIVKQSGGDFQYFQSTPGARKYLMMKTSAGKIVSINDATFTKYQRTEDRP